MGRGIPLHLKLTEKDREQVEALLSGGLQPVRTVVRALALRQLDSGLSTPEVGARVGLSGKTARLIGKRYQEGGLERALFDAPRPGQAPLLNPDQVQQVVALVCSSPPEGRARWTVRLLAEETVRRKIVPTIGRETIRILLESHDLKPWREKKWCVAKLDDDYIECMEDVLKVYEKPLTARAPVVCLDEKPVVLHEDTRPPIPMQSGQPARRDYEYKRCGTANVFCAVEPKAGVHFTKVTPTRSSPEFADFLFEIAAAYPAADTIHLVLDNLSTHTRKAVVDRFGEREGGWLWSQFTVHRTPKHGSWLNQAEIEIGLFSRQCLGKRRIANIDDLTKQADAWNERVNQQQTTIDWKFTRKKARLKLKYGIARS